MIDGKDRVYFRDIHDHMARLYQTVEGVRDLVTGALDTYMSLSNNRLTEIMRTLTVITTMFMPLTFVTSFFGMNFFFPERPISALMERPVLAFAIVLLIVIPAAMLVWMRRRRWLRG
jgi:magnesium transporter